ncbi:DUF3553 domain-containing protein, partial [Pseudomonadota bacterium]
MSSKHKRGDYVVNPNKLEWGPGIILDVAGSVVTVYFRDSFDRPVRKIETSYVDLVPASISSDHVQLGMLFNCIGVNQNLFNA